MNKQLALFFVQVNIKSYPQKLIASMITSFFVIMISSDITQILKYYSDLENGVWFYLIIWSKDVIKQAIYLTLTGAFIYLADFGFEVRSN